MQPGIVVTPERQPMTDLRFGDTILVAAVDELLDLIAELTSDIALGISGIDQSRERSVEVDRALGVIPAVVILDRLNDIGERAERSVIAGPGHPLQHALARGIVRQAE